MMVIKARYELIYSYDLTAFQVNVEPPAPVNKATLSPLMAKILRNIALADLVEDNDPV
jgi:hypothetical protein